MFLTKMKSAAAILIVLGAGAAALAYQMARSCPRTASPGPSGASPRSNQAAGVPALNAIAVPAALATGRSTTWVRDHPPRCPTRTPRPR